MLEAIVHPQVKRRGGLRVVRDHGSRLAGDLVAVRACRIYVSDRREVDLEAVVNLHLRFVVERLRRRVQLRPQHLGAGLVVVELERATEAPLARERLARRRPGALH